MTGDVPIQVIEAPSRFRIKVIDISGEPVEHRKVEARDIAGEICHTPFDFEVGPLLYVGLLKLSPEEHHLIV
jgi:hypothetical protein